MAIAFLAWTLLAAQPVAPPAILFQASVAELAEPVVGELRAVGPNWKFQLGTTTTTRLVRLGQVGQLPPPLPREPGLILVNGDRIAGMIRFGDDTALSVHPNFSPDPGAWRIPFALIRAAWWAPRPGDLPPWVDDYDWLPKTLSTDIVRLRNRDTLAGTVEQLSSNGQLEFAVKATGTRLRLNPEQLAAVVFNPALSVNRKPKTPTARIVLRDGTRLTVSALSVIDNVVSGTTTFGAKFQLPLAELFSLEMISPKNKPLSDLKPVLQTVQPYGSLGWPWQTNRSVKEHPLTLFGPGGAVGTYDHGLGTHPRTVLEYDLAEKYQRLESLVGLDTTTGRLGTATITILRDGTTAELPAKITNLRAGPAAELRLPLTGVKRLKLIIDFGPGGDVQADVNWGGAVLIE